MKPMQKPYSEACDRNKAPILSVLQSVFSSRTKVLEVGSGTGQHAVHFAQHLPHVQWQPSDVAEHLPGMRLWFAEANLGNLLEPIALDIDEPVWPQTGADAMFTSNTLHIVSWPRVERVFQQAGSLLPVDGVLAVYGPFNYGGRHTSESNARFDLMLRDRDPASGIRDFEKIDGLAAGEGLRMLQDHAMPANNRVLVWAKSS